MSEEVRPSEVIQRAADDGSLSKQPRFKGNAQSAFDAVIRWVKSSEISAPAYAADSRTRDKWLSAFWMVEPLWSGIISQTVLVDSGRAWIMIGGRNQVNKYTAMMHAADAGKGWREFFRKQSMSYRVTDMGALTELGRDGANGPLRAIYHVDPTLCRHMSDINFPLRYKPAGSKLQKWAPGDFFNVASLPSILDKFNSLGWCSTSRALDLTKIMYGVLMYDQEQLGAKMPQGIMILEGIDEQQLKEALDSRQANIEQYGREYFGGIAALASAGIDEMNIKLVALSQLPAQFNRVDFINQTMYGYALVSNYDPREFWPVAGGQLGTATETETQHRKASTKGALEFPHAWQERFQNELPDSLHFEFEERDAEGLLIDAEVAQAWAEVARTLYNADPVTFTGLLDREAALSLLVSEGIIPPEYTEFEEESQATDTEDAERKRVQEWALSLPQVQRAIEKFPDEPIVRYVNRPTGSRMTVLWSSGHEAQRPAAWRGVDLKTRQEERDIILFEEDEMDFTITEADVDRAIATWDRRMGEELAGVLEAEEIE